MNIYSKTVSVVALLLVACNAAVPEKGVNKIGISDINSKECLICNLPLSSYKGSLQLDEVHGLLLALNDEYKALSTYQQVTATYGEVRPFSNIKMAEQRHIDMLNRLFDTYGLSIPVNPWSNKVPVFKSVAAACTASIQAEIDNAGLYDKLLASTKRTDILDTYKRLQNASLQNHKAAFERCAE